MRRLVWRGWFKFVTRIELTISSEYGIMFVHDAGGKYIIPEGAGQTSVTHTDTCVAFEVLSHVDGEAKVIIDHEIRAGDSGEHVFSGKVRCASKSLALSDHTAHQFASVPLEDEYADVTIMMSEQPNPDVVICLVKNIETY
jgi:hypothetical protein